MALALGALSALAAVVVLSVGRAAVVDRPHPATRQAPAPLDVALLTADVGWVGPAGALASFTLWRQGAPRAAAQATTGADGRVAVRLEAGGAAVVVEAGDRIAVRAGDAISFTRTVPTLSADVDPATRTVSGLAPAGTFVELTTFDAAGGRVDTVIERAAADGRFSRVLPGGAALGAGTWGRAAMTTAHGDRFAARWDVATVEATLGSPHLTGRATLGRTVVGEVVGLDGQRAASAPARVSGAPPFTLTLEADGAARPIGPGDAVRLTIDARPALHGTAPALTAHVDGQADRVTGRGPPNTALYAVVHADDGVHGLPTTTDATGGYAVDFEGIADIGRDTRVFVALTHDRVTFRAPGFRQSVTATLRSPVLSGVAVPGTWVTANLTRRASAGERRAFGDAVADATGVFRLTLRESAGGPVLAVAAGDRILAAFGTGGEPRSLTVPNLAATADAATDTVSGVALPYTAVDVAVDGAPAARRRVRADQAGAFAVDYRSTFDLLPGTTGSVAMALDGDDAVVLPWSAPRIDVEIDAADVSGRAAAGSAVAVVLYRGGQAVAHGGATADAPTGSTAGGAWRVTLHDANGEPVAVGAGDRLAAVVGEWGTSFAVPPLAVEANPVTDAVRGTGSPRASLDVSVQRGAERLAATATTGPDGVFELDLAGRWDVRAGDAVAVAASLAHGTATARSRVPPPTVDLDTGGIAGFARAFAVVVADLRGAGGDARAAATGTADGFGRFAIGLQDAGGAAVAPRGGDRLTVEAGTETVTTVVPGVTLTLDAAGDTARISAPAGAATTTTAVNTLAGWRSAATHAGTVGVGGQLDALFGGALDIAAGTLVRAVVEPADGLAYTLVRREPLLGVQRGGSLVAGFAGSGGAVRLVVTRGGAEVAGQVVHAQSDGAFVGQVADTAKRPVPLQPGDVVGLRWSGGAPRYLPPDGAITMTVAPLSATLRTAAARIDGTAPPGATVFAGPSAAGDPGATRRLTADGDGRFTADLAAEAGPAGLAAGRAWDVVAPGTAGHRTFVTVVAPYLEATLGDARVVGRAAPLTRVRLVLSTAGRAVAEGGGIGDTSGHFEAMLRDPGRAQRGIAAGDVLVLREPGGAETTLVVPALSITVDRSADRLHGTAPPAADVAVRLRAPGRPDANLMTRADMAGAWRIAGRDLPSGWVLADVVASEARLSVANGHGVRAVPVAVATATPSTTATRVATAVPATPSPTPRDTPEVTPTSVVPQTVWLPVAARAARVGGRR
ncbi:hypothetical protein DCC79_05380 [bacterium]|nr:MAG: hypothetical protein DCC79_05380 [bacterium]